jgi:hypothetical protein
MSSQKTTNLNLHKWIGTDNVRRIEFNENWDTLDTKHKEQSDKIGTLTNLQTTDKSNLVNAVNEFRQEFLSDKADETTHGIGDKTTLLTTDKTTIVSAMNELFTNANNGKTDIASVIGSPATSGDTFAQLKTHIQNSKNDLATNLSAKGQTSVGTETLDALVDKVALVNTGKKWASGTATCGSSVVSFTNIQGGTTTGWLLTVTGITFKPKYIIAYWKGGATSVSDKTVYTEDATDVYPFMSHMFSYNAGSTTSYTAYALRNDVSPLSVTSTGFVLPVGSNNSGNKVFKWIAFE